MNTRTSAGTYGTILVDGESHRPIDVLHDRSAEQFASWLRGHPSPEIICRDRGGCYADGARQGAPRAIQVADRYHLLANLGTTVERLVAQHARCWEDDPLSLAPLPDPAPTPPSSGTLLERHQSRYEQIHTLVARGQTINAIAKHLHLDRKTVRKFAHASSPEAISTRGPHAGPALLRAFYEHLNRRWQEGCEDGAVLCSEIRALGYRGSARTVRRYLTRLRQGQAPHQPQSKLAPRTVAGLLLRHPDHLIASDCAVLERLMERCPDLGTARRLICGFAELVCGRQGEAALQSWLAEVTGSGLSPLVSFASGLRKDVAAVTAAVTLPWSSGVVEGHNTRIKSVSSGDHDQRITNVCSTMVRRRDGCLAHGYDLGRRSASRDPVGSVPASQCRAPRPCVRDSASQLLPPNPRRSMRTRETWPVFWPGSRRRLPSAGLKLMKATFSPISTTCATGEYRESVLG